MGPSLRKGVTSGQADPLAKGKSRRGPGQCQQTTLPAAGGVSALAMKEDVGSMLVAPVAR